MLSGLQSDGTIPVMILYNYTAINRLGQRVSGQVEADNPRVAAEMLGEQGRFGSEITAANEMGEAGGVDVTNAHIRISSKLKLKDRDRFELIQQIATSLQAQLPILTALNVVGQQNQRPSIRLITSEMIKIIKSGESLSYAFSQYPRSFNRLHIAMVSVGEASGQLGSSMGQLADLTQRELETRNDILTAAMYPTFVLGLGLISVAIIVTWILPKILSTMTVSAAALPWPTRVVLGISDFLQSASGIAVLAGLLIAMILQGHGKKTAAGRYLRDSIKLKIPIIGTVIKKWSISRFARTLGTLTGAGVNILEALKIVRNCMGNEVLAREVDQISSCVRNGSSLTEPLGQSGRFPPLLIQVVAVGEQTGQVSELLLKVANAFDKETAEAIKRFMAIFPAILITLLAMVIGFIVAATLLPIVQIQTAIPGL